MTTKTIIIPAIILSSFLSCICLAEKSPAAIEPPAAAIDSNDFYNSAHHWYDIYDKKNVINASPNQPRFEPSQITQIADNVLLYQKDNGGWPKNYDMRAILTEEQKQILINVKSDTCTTFDNCTTYSHIKYLAKVWQITKDEKYKDSALRGIDFIFSAQYPNGGWPQVFPIEKKYSSHITFNDDAMVGIMGMLKDIIDNKPYYYFVDSVRRDKVKIAFDKGLSCILKCQIEDNGKLTAWCQQHDENDLSPAKARAYELPSICNRESTGVVLFLMSLDEPGDEVINSIEAAIKWFEDSKITGIRIEEFDTPPFETPLRVLTKDKRVVSDANAPPIWARFYELGTHKPLFSNRKSELFYSLAEVDRERRAYGWYTYEPQKALDAYPGWKKKAENTDFLNYKIPPEAIEKEGPLADNKIPTKEYWINDNLVGRKTFYEDGSVAACILYKKGKEHGPHQGWYENRQLRFKIYYNNGIQCNWSRYWHDNGQLKTEVFFEDDKQHGDFKQWSQDGKLLGVSKFNMGTGLGREWYENGAVKYELNWQNGKSHGILKKWDEDGKLLIDEIAFFVNGEIVTKQEYIEAREKDPNLPDT